MTIYSSTPIRGYSERLLHYHAWSVDRRQIDCYHYQVDDTEAHDLIATGKAKQLTVPFACYREQRNGTTIEILA